MAEHRKPDWNRFSMRAEAVRFYDKHGRPISNEEMDRRAVARKAREGMTAGELAEAAARDNARRDHERARQKKT